MEQKKVIGSLAISAWILSVSIVVFNNATQLNNTLAQNNNYFTSFILLLITFSIYGIKNKKQLKI